MALAPYLLPLLGAQHGQPKPPGPISEKRLYWDFMLIPFLVDSRIDVASYVASRYRIACSLDDTEPLCPWLCPQSIGAGLTLNLLGLSSSFVYLPRTGYLPT